VDALVIAFGLVFVAELGDKTQLVAVSLATRYRALPVLAGLAIAQAMAQGLAVVVGGLLGAALPTTAISVGAGLLFLGFAVWTLRADDDGGEVEVAGRSVVVAVATAIFVAELGDKTMLASATLAAQGNPVLVWVGGTAGVASPSSWVACWVRAFRPESSVSWPPGSSPSSASPSSRTQPACCDQAPGHVAAFGEIRSPKVSVVVTVGVPAAVLFARVDGDPPHGADAGFEADAAHRLLQRGVGAAFDQHIGADAHALGIDVGRVQRLEPVAGQGLEDESANVRFIAMAAHGTQAICGLDLVVLVDRAPIHPPGNGAQ
jgi:putative Ca2+/H+ antiporter (TMEM165/GDT1 family)